jgi:hypothetical protein
VLEYRDCALVGPDLFRSRAPLRSATPTVKMASSSSSGIALTEHSSIVTIKAFGMTFVWMKGPKKLFFDGKQLGAQEIADCVAAGILPAEASKYFSAAYPEAFKDYLLSQQQQQKPSRPAKPAAPAPVPVPVPPKPPVQASSGAKKPKEGGGSNSNKAGSASSSSQMTAADVSKMDKLLEEGQKYRRGKSKMIDWEKLAKAMGKTVDYLKSHPLQQQRRQAVKRTSKKIAAKNAVQRAEKKKTTGLTEAEFQKLKRLTQSPAYKLNVANGSIDWKKVAKALRKPVKKLKEAYSIIRGEIISERQRRRAATSASSTAGRTASVGDKRGRSGAAGEPGPAAKRQKTGDEDDSDEDDSGDEIEEEQPPFPVP